MARKEFYNLAPPWKDQPVLYGDPSLKYNYRWAEWAENMDFEQITCPLYPLDHVRAGKRIGDLNVVLPSPKVPDLLWTQYSECLMTENVRSMFEDAGFSGFEALPVTVTRVKFARKGTEYDIPALWELCAIGRGGDAHPDTGVVPIEESRCEACGYLRYSVPENGVIVDESQWDGSDFFAVNVLSNLILITERVKDLIIKEELKDCHILRSRDLRWDW